MLASSPVKNNTTPDKAQGAGRILALDFTKGTLVLLMVFYHWMNYFVAADGSFYKYLRFLTPSFIFITGFLITQVYMTKYQAPRSRVAVRLLVRGVKLLAIVLCLNFAISAARLRAPRESSGGWNPIDMALGYLTGTVPAAFAVLLPIGYLLMIAAALAVGSEYYKGISYVVGIAIVLWALVFWVKHIPGGYLEIFSIGMVGVCVGYVRMESLHGLLRSGRILVLAYCSYLAAITAWNDVYPLQIVGVCLNLAVIYRIGGASTEHVILRDTLILLGKYSLFGYITQIVLLQALHKVLPAVGAGIGVQAIALLACTAGTVVSVKVLDRARKQSAGLNWFYSAVFS